MSIQNSVNLARELGDGCDVGIAVGILHLPVENADKAPEGLSDEENPFRPEGMVYSDSRSAPGAPPLEAPDPTGGNPLG